MNRIALCLCTFFFTACAVDATTELTGRGIVPADTPLNPVGTGQCRTERAKQQQEAACESDCILQCGGITIGGRTECMGDWNFNAIGDRCYCEIACPDDPEDLMDLGI